MKESHSGSKRPSLLWLMTEPGRALAELGMAYSLKKFYKSDTVGDGHPVMILPGFMSTHTSTKILREYIGELGYNVFDWGLGRNYGKVEYMELLIESLDELFLKNKQQISLVGWSLGGVFARQLAKERPELVRQVITLGSPFRGITEPNNVEWIFTAISGGKKAENTNHALLANLPIPAQVPTTAIYSKEDGIVSWEMCMELEEDDIHQNIQVRGSHIGLGVNPSVLSVVADRLQYTRDNWRYFKPRNTVENLFLYPSL
jgi:pimeloyl-ACP methyl ester carboxylesterase